MLVLKSKKLAKLLFLFAFVLSSSLFAGDEDRTGTDGASQLLQPVGAKGIATFGANIATTNSIDALYWNPAGLSRMTSSAEGTFSTMNIFNDIRINYAAVAYNTGDLGAFGITLKTFDFGNIPITTNADMDGESGQVFSPTFATIGISYAIGLTDRVSVGLNTKIVHESIPRASATAIAFDIGLQYRAFAGYDGLAFGIVVKNIGTDMTYSGAGLTDAYTIGGRQDYLTRDASSNDLPSSIEIGLGYTYDLDSDNALTTSTNFTSNNFSSDAFKLGVEYAFQNFVMVRAGYNLETGLESDESLYRFTMGAGINYELGGTPLSIDYAYRDSQYFDSNNIFSFTIGF